MPKIQNNQDKRMSDFRGPVSVQNTSGREVKAKKHPYYEVLMDTTDSGHIVSIACEPAHDKTYNKSCATGEDSNQTAHPHGLIRVFADHMCLLQPPACPFKEG